MYNCNLVKKTFPSFSGHLAVMRRQIMTPTVIKQLRKGAAKEQELVEQSK